MGAEVHNVAIVSETQYFADIMTQMCDYGSVIAFELTFGLLVLCSGREVFHPKDRT